MLEAADGDLELRLRATVSGDELELDFGGSARQHDGNLNCPLAVTVSACYFALRVLTDPDVPPCAGAYRPLTVSAPEGSLLNARPPAAVAAGNVETSSRVADLVLAAFGRACGQGTMNNLTLGNASSPTTRHSAAARAPARTPTARAPCTWPCRTRSTRRSRRSSWSFRCGRVEYSLRRGSGGDGRRRGGDGVVRELEALAEMRYLADHRAPPPPPSGRGGRPSGRTG